MTVTHTHTHTVQDYVNCHSFQLAEGFNGTHAYENFSSFTKTLQMEWNDSIEHEDGFTVAFMTENNDGTVFQVSILGEKLSSTWQVNLNITLSIEGL